MSKKVALYKLQNVGDYTGLERSTTDDTLVELWLKKGKAENTQAAYRRDIDTFRAMVGKPLQALLYADLQAFSEAVVQSPAATSTKARMHNAVKSLLSFAMKLGYIRMNPGAMLDAPAVPHDLAARIMTEESVLKMFTLEPDDRNRAILRLLYEGALRVSELCGLTWASLQPNASVGGQVTVVGKGEKIRAVPISRTAYDMVLALRGSADYDAPVFTSRQGGGALTRVQVFRIVAAAAKRADVPVPPGAKGVSPHWLRHAHASHALDRKAPVHLVRDTLGHSSIAITNSYAHAKPAESSSTYLVTFNS